jgi:hypothetical protein
MIKPGPPPTRGIAGLALLFCIVALAVGLGFDFARDDAPRFGLVAQPGGRAVLGVVVAVSVVLIAHAMRWLLRRRKTGVRDAVDHA